MPIKGFANVHESKKSSSMRKHQFKVVDLSKYTDTEQFFRPVGYLYSERIHWVERNFNGKVVRFPKLCLNYNQETDSIEDKGCPWCKAKIKGQTRYYQRVINRDAVDNEPKKLTPKTDYEKKKHTMDDIEGIHYKEEGSRSWTPVEVLSLPYGAVKKLQDLEKLKNTITSKKTGKKKTFPLGDAKYGCEISITYNKDKKADAYQFAFESRSPLTEEELNYLYPSFEDEFELPNLKEEKAEFEKIKGTLILEKSEDAEEQAQKTIDGLGDDDDDDEIPDFDEEEAPKKKKKVVVEDDDDDEEDEDDSEDEELDDDESEDDDEDEEDDSDDDDEEDEEEEEEQPKKKKKKSKVEDDDGFDF